MEGTDGSTIGYRQYMLKINLNSTKKAAILIAGLSTNVEGLKEFLR